MTYVSLVDQAHDMLAKVIQAGDMVIDATVGNGYDTLFLAEQVGDTGKVLGFDVQKQALDNTRRRLQQNNLLHRVHLLRHSHVDVTEHIPAGMRGRIKAVVFNLGYLPGSDKVITTRGPDTLIALNAVLPQLLVGGVISIVAYRGHNGGEEEAQAVLAWGLGLDRSLFIVQEFQLPTSSQKSPFLIMVKKFC